MSTLTIEQIITQCAWCWKVKHGNHWLPFSGGNLAKSLDNVSHGACPDCFKKLTGKDYEEQ